MSYESGSLLSIGAGATLEQVLVLSDGRVATKLFAGKPVSQRDILSLSDWLMLAEGQTVIVSSKTPQLPPSPAAEPVVAPLAEVATVYPIGTMLRWIKDDQNKRVAIVLKDSVLQVKETIGGTVTGMVNGVRVKRTFFKDFAEWKASLPEGGTISVADAKPWAPTIEEKAKSPIVATTDADYIVELAKRYLVRSQLYQEKSINENIENSRSSLKREVDRFAGNLSVENNNINTILCYAKNVTHYSKWLQNQLTNARGKTADELSEVTYTFLNCYKQKLFAYKNGLKYEICSSAKMVALAPSAEGSKYRGKALVGDSFADLGIEMKADGKPRLEVSYCRRRIEI